jgi:hypothetical protein
MESWKLVWKKGFLPNLTNAQLTILLHGLKNDSQRLLQGCTTTPPPLLCVHDWPCEAACGLGYILLETPGRAATVGEVEEFFARLCYDADEKLGEPAACRWFLNFWDDTPRSELRGLMIAEIESNIAERNTRAENARSDWEAESAYKELAACREPILAGVVVTDDAEADLGW